MFAPRAIATPLVLAAAACSRDVRTVEHHDATVPDMIDAGGSTGGGDAAQERPPLGGYPWQIDLDGGLGAVSIPLGAREPRPIMIALHGAGDRPGWACGEWRGITNAYPFLVCPQGVGSQVLAWSSPADTKARIARAIAAVKAMFGSWIREDVPIVLAGFSMGATQAVLVAQSEPGTYRRIAISESAYAPEPVMAFARGWTSDGGQRALFSCTTFGCEAPYRNAARNVAAHHVPARLNIAGTNMHGIWQTVVASMTRDWPWLVEGAEGWETYAAAKAPEGGPLPGKTETFDAR